MKKLMGVVVSLVLLAGCSTGGSEEKTIKVLTSSGYDPYEIVDENGNLTGFDIELAEAIAKNLGYTIEWTDMDFNGIIGALQVGQGDLAIAGISPDSERAKVVDFSDIYYAGDEETTNYVLYKADSSISGMDDLDGKIAGVQIGTIQEAAINEIKADLNLTTDPRASIVEMVQEIKVGRIDFVVVEKAVADEFIKTNSELATFKLEGEFENSTGNAIAFPKGSELVTKFDEQIAAMQADGSLDTLITKWFTAE
ncbi:MAG: transporter substrate-binding domain-containing protein [Erysipelotrichaceae bacterium]